ncbi:MAG: BrnT family toxin [Candidatus Omnitrophica bacterium]|nr:BrnT family toxin [Candidatus Omnitrophota bacterium]
MKILDKLGEFQWDKGNKGKNHLKHKVTDQECEEVFFDQNKKIFKDILHSDNEERYILLGQTKGNRILFVVFTIRSGKIRVISARDLNEREKKLYEEKT